ncbi:hypothetical protein NDU88_012519 [Pleurodeles waltl]|uniref:Uncharacterized protein n=1 Tax=Pleurodeles waltl TaxID=8319 RepID=A0AAV7R4V1_PLEWA|nr:hypothetical protein NDU88_012519 [Pleurodeles waltl]
MRRGRTPSAEPNGPAVATVVPCAQVRRDANAAGGDGGELRMHPCMSRPLCGRMPQAPNRTGSLRLRTDNWARSLSTRMAARPDCDPVAVVEGAAARNR